jgi:hypothetical protein
MHLPGTAELDDLDFGNLELCVCRDYPPATGAPGRHGLSTPSRGGDPPPTARPAADLGGREPRKEAKTKREQELGELREMPRCLEGGRGRRRGGGRRRLPRAVGPADGWDGKSPKPPRMQRRPPLTAKCNTCCGSCWSRYSAVPVCKMEMQMLIRHLLEIVSDPNRDAKMLILSSPSQIAGAPMNDDARHPGAD